MFYVCKRAEIITIKHIYLNLHAKTTRIYQKCSHRLMIGQYTYLCHQLGIDNHTHSRVREVKSANARGGIDVKRFSFRDL